MPTGYETYSDNDVKFLTYVKEGMGDITNMHSPLLQDVKALCKKETFGPKGLEKRHYEGHSINVKMGPSYMDYPNRSMFQSGLYRQVPTVVALTYAIDHATMDAYKNPQAGNVNNNKGALVKLEEETKKLAEGLGHRLDFFFATGDASGKVGVSKAGASTTSVPTYFESTAWTGLAARAVGLSQIYPEVDYDVVNPTTRAVVGTFRVPYAEKSRINKSTHVLDLTGLALAGAPADGDYIVPKDSAFNAPYGLPKLFAGSKTGLWQGKIVSDSVEDQTMMVDAQTNSLNNYLLEKALGKRRIRNMRNDIQPFKFLMGMAQRLEYISAAWAMFQIDNGQGKKFDTSVETARYLSEDFMDYPHIDPSELYGVDMSDLYLLEQFGPGIISPDGLIWRQAKSSSSDFGKGVWYTLYGYIFNWMIMNPQNHFRITKLYVNPNAPTLANYSATS